MYFQQSGKRLELLSSLCLFIAVRVIQSLCHMPILLYDKDMKLVHSNFFFL